MISSPKKRNGYSQDSIDHHVSSEGVLLHSIPQLPVLYNSFGCYLPNEVTMHSSKDNLLTNPKSSSYLTTNKSKSRKSRVSSKSNKSILSSLSVNRNKSKSSSFSRQTPKVESDQIKLLSQTKLVNKSFENAKVSENSIPHMYFSLNDFPKVDSTISGRHSLNSFRTAEKHKRITKTIKRNILIYSVKKEKNNYLPQESLLRCSIEPSLLRGRNFNNKQNQIFNDPTFFEEGLLQPHNRKTRLEAVKVSALKILLYTLKYIFQMPRKTKLFPMLKSLIYERYLIMDILILMVLTFYYFWIPIGLAFSWEAEKIPILSITGLLFLFYLVVKLLNTRKKDQKTKVMGPKLLNDLVGIMVLGVYCLHNDLILRVFGGVAFLIMKFPEIKDITILIQARLRLRKSLDFSFMISLVFFRVFWFANFTACAWIYLGKHYHEEDLNWLSSSPQEISQLTLYFRSLSTNFANVTLIGLGLATDLIKPVNAVEYAFNSLVTACGFLFIWYNLQNFLKLFSGGGDQNELNLMEFEKILANYGLEFEERMNFTKELGHVLSKNNEQRLFGELLRQMSPSLQENLLTRIYWPILMKIPVLHKNFTKRFLVKLLHKIKIITIAPNEILFKEGEYKDLCLYYIIQGEAECILRLKEDEKSKMKIRNLKANDYFREFSFFSHQPDRFSVKCPTLCTLLKIDLSDFLETLKDFPLDNENYAMIKERIRAYENMAQLYPKCENCRSKHHQILDCPFLTYNPRKTNILNNFLRSSHHIERRIYQRKHRKVDINALSQINRVQVGIVDFQDNYHNEIEKILDLICTPSENENSETGPYNELQTTEHKSNESNMSVYSRDAYANNYVKPLPGEEYIGNPPSIFLQSPSKKSRKSMTESIFHESDEEDYEEERPGTRQKCKTADAKTLNELEIDNEPENEDEEDDDYEEDEYKKGMSKLLSVTNTDKRPSESARGGNINTSNNNRNLTHAQTAYSHKSHLNMQKIIPELESKLVSEKDTYHVLQNFEKLYRVNNPIITTIGTGFQNTFTTVSGKKGATSFVGSYSKSNSSSYPKKPPLMLKSSSSSFGSALNKRSPYYEFVNQPLFDFEFDRPKEFHSFLPHNNLEEVLRGAHINDLLRDSRFAIKNKSFYGTSNVANTSFSTSKKAGISEKTKNYKVKKEFFEN